MVSHLSTPPFALPLSELSVLSPSLVRHPICSLPSTGAAHLLVYLRPLMCFTAIYFHRLLAHPWYDPSIMVRPSSRIPISPSIKLLSQALHGLRALRVHTLKLYQVITRFVPVLVSNHGSLLCIYRLTDPLIFEYHEFSHTSISCRYTVFLQLRPRTRTRTIPFVDMDI
jgi:hypothetical protein